MEKFFTVFGLIMMVVLPVGMVLFLLHDLAHPELWSDWMHNPKVYGPLELIVILPLLVWCAYVAWNLRLALKRYERTMAQRKNNHR